MSTEPREGQKKVAIIGFAESWKQAPWSDESIEMWALNEFWKYAPRWNRWFELHDAETLGSTSRDMTEGEQKRHIEWLSRDHGKPIYMQPQFVGKFPNAVAYPLDQMIAEFGRYFTSSIGYMLAMAISEGYTWIGLYGVDLASDVEYPHQRPNTEYLVGLARGRGIHVEIASGSAINKSSFLYGYEREPATSPAMAALQKQLDHINKERDKVIATLNTLDGAQQAYVNVIKMHDYMARGCQPSGFGAG